MTAPAKTTAHRRMIVEQRFMKAPLSFDLLDYKQIFIVCQ